MDPSVKLVYGVVIYHALVSEQFYMFMAYVQHQSDRR